MRVSSLLVAAVAAACLLSAGCGTSSVDLSDEAPADLGEGGTVTQPPSTSSPDPTSTTTTTSTSTTTTSTTTTTTEPPPPLRFDEEGVPVNGQTRGVVRTADGWVLPVLETLEAGWRVWTPCGREGIVTTGDYIESVDVVIDPGHGGSETGAVGPAGLVEGDLNLDVSRRVVAGLEAAGFTALLTRDADVRVPIVTRAEIALALDPIALISIHHNAGTEAPSAQPGTEMFHQVDSPESKRLAGLLMEETRDALAAYDADWVAMEDAGAMVRENQEGGDFYGMLRRPAGVPSVISEALYLANASEEALLQRDDVRADLARAVVDAVTRFASTEDPGGYFTADPIFRGYGSSGTGRTNNCTDPALP